jgi:hypothetical protein
MEQPYIRDDQKKIQDLVREAGAKTGDEHRGPALFPVPARAGLTRPPCRLATSAFC